MVAACSSWGSTFHLFVGFQPSFIIVCRYDVPLMVLGGGGYTVKNVARCWAWVCLPCLCFLSWCSWHLWTPQLRNCVLSRRRTRKWSTSNFLSWLLRQRGPCLAFRAHRPDPQQKYIWKLTCMRAGCLPLSRPLLLIIIPLTGCIWKPSRHSERSQRPG